MDEQGLKIRRRQEEGRRDRRLSAPGLQRAPKASKQTIFLARGWRRHGGRKGNRGRADAVVEGDRKGGVVVIGSKKDTY